MTTSKTTTTTTLGRNAIGQHLATVIMDHVAKNVLAKWNPKTHAGITREQALEAARQIFGYVPPAAWSYTEPHPVYGVRNVGRPAPKTSAPASKSTARPGRVTKTSATKTPVKGAPAKTTGRTPAKATTTRKTSATPATVARVASKSTTTRRSTAPASA